MAKVHLMTDALASQVAAGEVVERPASVVKELVENAIDAGARRIEVRVSRGGISLIRVVDDGEGMAREDAMLALERHATSKIRTKEDLADIRTLGFRGEALPSIASVSKFRLATRERGALSGTEIAVDGGRLGDVRDSGEAPGTQIEVRSLFFNVPARRKFLKSEATEMSHIEQQVRVQAIAHPAIGFALVNGERTVFQLPPAAALLDRIRGLIGAEQSARLARVDPYERGGVRIEGYVGKPGVWRSNRLLQFTFLNRRPIESPVLNHGLREGYGGALPKGQHPICFLFIEMDPRAVDVNVHPAKREVRFHTARIVQDVIAEAVGRALSPPAPSPSLPAAGGGPKPGAARESGAPGASFAQRDRATTLPDAGVSAPNPSREPPQASRAAFAPAPEPELIPTREQHALRRDWGDLPTRQSAAPSPGETAPDPAPPDAPPEAKFRLIGALRGRFTLMESEEGLVIMDARAAHERILFERLRRRAAEGGVPSQRLLVPLTLELTPREFDLLRQGLPALREMGFVAEEFGSNTLKIDALPATLAEGDPAALVNAILDEARGLPRTTRGAGRLTEDQIATAVSREASQSRAPKTDAERGALLRDLLACEMPYCCPRGRPTLIQISLPELERKFGLSQG